MSNTIVGPSTVDGIKRLAKAIKRERALTHHEALDLAAKRAGYQNLRHAQHQLADSPQRHAIYLSAYWSNRELRKRGRETLKIWLPKPLLEIASRHEMPRARNLGWFHVEAEDHLERRVDLDDLESAQKALFAAARTLRFMAATGLRPTTTLKQLQPMRRFEALPGKDHPSEWLDTDTGAWVYMDEPYEKSKLTERAAWASAQSLQMIRPTWEGIYYPGKAIPFLFCVDHALADRLHRQLQRLHADRIEPVWDGASEPYSSAFISPAREASGQPRRGRPMPSYGPHRGALPYGARKGGERSLWRPERRMALELHLKLGPLLSSLCVSGLSHARTTAISRIRSRLDDWLQMEYPSEEEMSQEQFHNAYYGSRYSPIKDAQRQVVALQQAVTLLEEGYLDCKPRRDMVNKLRSIAAAIAEVDSKTAV